MMDDLVCSMLRFLIPTGRTRFLVFAALFGTLGACASQIPRTRGVKPRQVASAFDGQQVVFARVDRPSQKISLSDFMVQEGYDALLLTFGSKACAACNRKADEIQSRVIGKHPFMFTDAGRRFAIVGVNTDPDPERLGPFLKQYPFIRWSDPSGAQMLRFFMEPGETFRVPLTVFVTRQGVMWRIRADEVLSVDAMMAKVALSLSGGSEGPAKGTTDGTPPGESSGPIKGPEGTGSGTAGISLAHPHPDRWKDLQVTDCQGTTRAFADLLSSAMEPRPLVLQLAGPRCESACQEQHRVLTAACQPGALLRETHGMGAGSGEGTLRAAEAGNSRALCQVWTLVEPQEAARGLSAVSAPGGTSGEVGESDSFTGICADPQIIRGGHAVHETFKSLFDWNAPRSVDAEGYVVVEAYGPGGERGPQVLVFDEKAHLIHAQEGFWRDHHYQNLHKMDFPGPLGMNFPLYRPVESSASSGPDTGFDVGQVRGLSKIREGYDFTVLAFFQTDCASCEKEFKHWSAPQGLVDFCAARPGFCQIYGVENRYRPQGWSLDQFYQNILRGFDDPMLGAYAGFQGLGIRVPLLLDPTSDEEDQYAFKNRIHDGYMIGISRELKFLYRKAVIDSEGKLRGVFVAPDDETSPDPVEEFLKREFQVGGLRSDAVRVFNNGLEKRGL